MPSLPSGTVTFLFTDLEGSTRLLQQLGGKYAAVLEDYRRLLRAAFAVQDGQEVDTQGDALFVAFARARDAIAAAVAAQRALAEHPWPDGAIVQARMGLHTGEPQGTAGGYVGIDVHRAARIGHAGHGGQILLSQTAYELIADNLPEGVSLRDLGSHRLKDLTQPEHLYEVAAAGLPAEFPPLRSLDAHPNNLPVQLTSFVGREQELRELANLVDRHRLATLIGAGGTGKTRLALEFAAQGLERYADGAWWVDLAGLTDPSLVAQAVAVALRVREQPGTAVIDTLRDFLRFRSALLLLDNCEHLLTACARLAGDLLQHCPEVRILATSREGLAIAGEALYPVPPLTLLDPSAVQSLDALSRFEAVRLFIDRAAAVLPSFRLTERNAGAVAQICYRLDGIPLAVELAAGRVTTLSPEQIAFRLDDQFRLLTGGSRIAMPRHQTLQAAMDWSFQSLATLEQAVFRRLSVFAGGFTLAAAEAVCAGDGIDAPDVLDLLSRLLDKSLVVIGDREGERRYRLLEPVRQYARDRLREAGETDRTRDQHLAWFVTLAEVAERELRGHGQVAWLQRLESDHANLRASLEWALAGGKPDTAVRLAAMLLPFWDLHTHFTEGRRWLSEALAAGAETSVPRQVKAKGLTAAAELAAMQHDFAQATALATEGLSIYRDQQDFRGAASALAILGYGARWRSDFEQASAVYRESLALYEEAGDAFGVARSHASLGTLARVKRQYREAMANLTQSLDLFREVGDRQQIATVLYQLGLVARAEGLFEKATTYAEEALTLSHELEDVHSAAHAQLLLGTVARHQGDYERAAALHNESLPVFQNLGDRVCTATTLTELGLVAQWHGDLDRAAMLHKDGLRRRRDLGDKPGMAECLERLATVVGQRDQGERAARLLGAADVLREVVGVPLPPVEQTAYHRLIADLRATLGEAAFSASWAAGRTTPLDDVIASALENV